jgi:hypothetical protein
VRDGSSEQSRRPSLGQAEETVVATFPNELWGLVRGIPRTKVELLELAEDRGHQGVAERIAEWLEDEQAARARSGIRTTKADRLLVLNAAAPLERSDDSGFAEFA